MRQAKDDQEWEAALEVQVALAGDNTTSMRLTSSGTLLLPPGRDGSIQPIVPMCHHRAVRLQIGVVSR